MFMKVLQLPYQDGLTELEYLEQIYKKVRLNERVKFNGKVYTRIVPKNNKYFKHQYHFCLSVSDIYKGNFMVIDEEGESVNSICEYKVEIVK